MFIKDSSTRIVFQHAAGCSRRRSVPEDQCLQQLSSVDSDVTALVGNPPEILVLWSQVCHQVWYGTVLCGSVRYSVGRDSHRVLCRQSVPADHILRHAGSVDNRATAAPSGEILGAPQQSLAQKNVFSFSLCPNERNVHLTSSQAYIRKL